MRIVLTANYSPWSRYRGGGQRSTHFLASALAARGHDVSVVFTKPPWEQVATPALSYRVVWAALADFRSRREAPFRPLCAVSVAGRVRELAREKMPCVVHSQGEEGALVSQVAHCPFVLTPRYPHYPAEVVLRAKGIRRAVAWLSHAKYLTLAIAARNATLVCTTSRASAGAVERAFGIPKAQLRVVPNGVDPEFLVCERRAEAHRGPLVFFGRIEADKGVAELLDAYQRTLHHRRKLVIVGDGSRVAWLRGTLAARGLNDWVEVHSWESAAALAARLSAAALVVLPSLHESFGNTMIEALAAAAPLVTSDVSALSERIRHAETAMLVKAGDVAALAQTIDGLLSDAEAAERLGRAGRSYVSAHFAWDKVAAEYEQIYAEAALLRQEGGVRGAASGASRA